MAQAYRQPENYEGVKHRASTMHLGVGQASGINAATTVNFASRLRSGSTHGIKSLPGQSTFGATSRWNASSARGGNSKWDSSTRTSGIADGGSATVSGRTPSPSRSRPAPKVANRMAATTSGSRRPQGQQAANGTDAGAPMVSNDFISRIEKIKAMKRGSGTAAASPAVMTSTFSDARSKLAQRAQQQAPAKRNYPSV